VAEQSITEAVIALADPARRNVAARALAERLGAASVLLLLRDPAVSAIVPAPGFPQTMRGGPKWRLFLKLCLHPGYHVGEVESPEGSLQRAEAVARDGLVLLMCGGQLDGAALAEIEKLMPLLACALHGEQRVALARAEADDARSLANRAQVLAMALDAARQEATRLNAQLRDEQRRKDEFLAMLAHELRNPLAPLVTSIEIMRQRGSDQHADASRLLEIMRRQSAHLTRLVDDLLDISRVTRGKIELRPELHSLWDVVTNAVEVNRGLILAKQHELELLPPAAQVTVHGDPVRLTQIVSNLLHNAAKYTPSGGHIVVEAGCDMREAFVRVADNGIGIAPDMIHAVFELFAQAPTAPEHSLGGLGIGLTLVKSLVEMHGGRVSAHSAGLGKGSTFTIRLPLGERVRTEPAFRAEAGDAAILLLTADCVMADAIRAMVEQAGRRLEVAYSAPTALQLPVHVHFDAVIVDAELPDIDVQDLIHRLRRILKPATRIVVVGETPVAATAFDVSIAKPVTPDAIEALLSPPVERHREESGAQGAPRKT
jgi:signal transduction histidine kinase/CheY-like chemotaxis protein